MTIEEAIDCLEGTKIYLQMKHLDTEAIDMAIEALKAETLSIYKEPCRKEYIICPTCSEAIKKELEKGGRDDDKR